MITNSQRFQQLCNEKDLFEPAIRVPFQNLSEKHHKLLFRKDGNGAAHTLGRNTCLGLFQVNFSWYTFFR